MTEDPNTNLPVTWEEELAKYAKEESAQEANAGGGTFFSTRAGQLALNGVPFAGNQVACVVLDAVLENVYYEGDYDPDAPQPPKCFAFGRDEAEMAPHEAVGQNAEAEACADCPKNKWGTADKGKGKACRNVRRLALIPAGTIDQETGVFAPFKDPKKLEQAEIAYLKLAVMSVKGYANYVKQVAGAFSRPLWAMYTLVKVVPDPKAQHKTLFTALGKVPDELIPVLKQRHQAAGTTIEFPYAKFDAVATSTEPKKTRKY